MWEPKTIREVAADFGRSYSWVYEHLRVVGNAGCYREGWGIKINRTGYQALKRLHEQAPRRGRPPKKRAS